ncbi:Crp/Fnr family transcriptional regulator [Hymenobacter sp. B81]|uniref:Crp/Fnr family transcriptional regulator n=1 Tax=Hymenobacter sp. B81 TaxID=3344878 RepID=UPI0037DC0275
MPQPLSPLTATLHQFSPLPAAAATALDQCVARREVARNAALLAVGEVSRHLYFVHTGLARVFYFHEAVDVTDYFAIDQQFIGAVASLFTGTPSHKGIQVLEDSVVYAIAYADLERLGAQFHEVERAGRLLATFGMLEGQQRIESIRFHDAARRYQELGDKYPGLLNRCPLKHIASYLGITQVSLSRLRAAAAATQAATPKRS